MHHYPFIVIAHSKIPKLIVFQGKLDSRNLKALKNLSIRREIRDKLLAGNASVWLFLEGSDQKLNEKRLAALRKYLKTATKKAMEAFDIAAAATTQENDSADDTQPKLPLIVKFAIVRAPHESFESKLLRNNVAPMLPKSLPSTNEPLTIPVFGKGRALTIISGDELNEQKILNVAYYVTGSCSCEIKIQNPGIDLFIPLSWDPDETSKGRSAPKPLPDILVPIVDNHKKNVIKSIALKSNYSDDKTSESAFNLRNALYFSLVAVIAILALGTLLLLRKK